MCCVHHWSCFLGSANISGVDILFEFSILTHFKKWGIEYRQLVKQNRKYLTLSSQVYFHTHINDPHMLEHMLGDEKLFYDRDGWKVRSCVYSRVFHFMIMRVA